MFIIQDILVSEDVMQERFACQLDACKGACCWEGDLGAPLDEEELPILERIYADVKPFLRAEGIKAIEAQGKYVIQPEEEDDYATPLIDNRDCAYLIFEKNGIAKCGIEKAYEAGKVDFKKPISCHLYPIRIVKNEHFEALNYDRWDICGAACSNGKTNNIKVYAFLKDAIVRKYGLEFYEELDAAANFEGEEEYV